MTKKTTKKSTTAVAVVEEHPVALTKEQLPDTVDGCGELARSYKESARKVLVVYAWNTGYLAEHAVQLKQQAWDQFQKKCKAEGRKPTEKERGALRPYGANVIGELATKFKVDPSNLAKMRQFFNMYPDSKHALAVGIDWSAQRLLLAVPDDKRRAQMEKRAQKEDMTYDDVRKMVEDSRKGKHGKKNEAAEAELAQRRAAEQEAADPVLYFTNVNATLAGILEAIQDLFKPAEKMMTVTFDEKQTDADDFRLVKNEGLAAFQTSERIRDLLLEQMAPIKKDLE